MSQPFQPILALDIGTRKVAGVVAMPQGIGLKVLAAQVMEHPDRAMLDGQVHKVEAVAEVVRSVKRKLEKETGLEFTAAAVAAAGRTLLTQSAVHKRSFPYPHEINRQEVLSLELAAARAAQRAIQSEHARQKLHCVGYSALRFTLDGEMLDDLVGHLGQEITVEVLATFLPRQVVDGLMAVLRRAGLAAQQLTLEPIAAIEITIPVDLRRMNLALVDVGAGTSDIALTREGSVYAYAMVTQAGDEITERLCEHYLLDFQEGERVKRLLSSDPDTMISLRTILGQEQKLSVQAIRTILLPDVQELAQAIAKPILQFNHVPPRAVIMVGGGSATPGLGECLAEALSISHDRVGVRGPETIPDLENTTGALNNIQGITPLGIAWSALHGRGLSFITVRVNAHPVQMLALTETPTVFDALLAGGQDLRSLIPRPGQARTYTLNGKLMTLPGTLGTLATLSVNGKEAGLDTVLHAGDAVEWVAAQDGMDAVLVPEQVSKPKGPFWCTINGQHQELELILLLGSTPVSAGQVLLDRAELTWASQFTLRELIPAIKDAPERTTFSVRVNKQLRLVEESGFTLFANGQPVTENYRPRPNDRIEWNSTAPQTLSLQKLVPDLPMARPITVRVNGQLRTLDTGGARIFINGKPASQHDQVPNHSEVLIETQPEQAPLLSQVLEGLDLKPSPTAGTIRMTVNGKEAGFATPLSDGAEVEITFG